MNLKVHCHIEHVKARPNPAPNATKGTEWIVEFTCPEIDLYDRRYFDGTLEEVLNKIEIIRDYIQTAINER